jgi:hypothetical protein
MKLRARWLILASALVAGAAYLPTLNAASTRQHVVPKATHGGTVVVLCDGVTSVEITGLKKGQAMSHQQAATVSNELMAQWQRKHPNALWEVAQAESPKGDESPSATGSQGSTEIQVPAANQTPAGASSSAKPSSTGEQGQPAAQQGDTYASFTPRDEMVWALETKKFIDEGKGFFHDAKALGGTIGVSCDMCHPDAANTHPETYPKYQVQLQRVALLRDMINWCIENPLKGKPLSGDDPKLRAVEAYILAQRANHQLTPGKH